MISIENFAVKLNNITRNMNNITAKLDEVHNDYLQALMKKRIILMRVRNNEDKLYKKLVEEKYEFLRIQIILKSSYERINMLKDKSKIAKKIKKTLSKNCAILDEICSAYEKRGMSLFTILSLNKSLSICPVSHEKYKEIIEILCKFNEFFRKLEEEKHFHVIEKICETTMHCQKLNLYELVSKNVDVEKICSEFIMKIKNYFQLQK